MAGYTVLGEKGAYQRLIESCRHAQEAAVELGAQLSNGQWALVATQFQQMERAIHELRNSRAARGLR